MQEKTNTECCTPDKKPTPSPRKPCWGKVEPSRSIRREAGKGKRCPHARGAAEEWGLPRLSRRDCPDLISGQGGTTSSSFYKCCTAFVTCQEFPFLFAGPFFLPQFTKRQRGISTRPPHPHGQALLGCVLAKILYSIKSTLYFLYNPHPNLQAWKCSSVP